jgi:hypothetical protein
VAVDDGYVVQGYVNSTDGDVVGNAGGRHAWVFKLDLSGILQWQRIWPENTGLNMYKTNDDGMLIYNGGTYVYKLQADGQTEWTQQITGTPEFLGNGLVPASDGGFLVVGNVGPPDVWLYDIILIKTDALLQTQWTTTFGGNSNDTATEIIIDSNNDIYLGGVTFSVSGNIAPSHGIDDTLVAKLDAQGNLLWNHTFGGSYSEQFVKMAQAQDGGILLTSWVGSVDGDVVGNHGGMDTWIFKLPAPTLSQAAFNVSGLSVYPNPGSGRIFIQTDQTVNEITIMDLTGKIVLRQVVNPNEIDISHLLSGIYLIQIGTDEKIFTQKLIKH